jgi:hypothetical protein
VNTRTATWLAIIAGLAVFWLAVGYGLMAVAGVLQGIGQQLAQVAAR